MEPGRDVGQVFIGRGGLPVWRSISRIRAICSEFQTKMALETKRNRSRFLSDAAKLSKCLLLCTLLANVGSDRESAQRDLFEYRAGNYPRWRFCVQVKPSCFLSGRGQVVKTITTNNGHNWRLFKNSAPISPARIIKAYDGKPQMAIKSVRDWLQTNRRGSPRGPFAAVDSEQRGGGQDWAVIGDLNMCRRGIIKRTMTPQFAESTKLVVL
jgi:hypothetical protein